MKYLSKIKKNRGIIAFSIIVFHFLMVFLFTAPINIVGKKLNHYSGYYIKPIFNQQWSLFAPAPIEQNRIYYRNDKDQEWVDLSIEDHNKADKYFITAHWRFSIGSSNLLYWIGRDLEYFEKSNGGLPKIIKEKYFKRYFSNALIKKFTSSMIHRRKIKSLNKNYHQVKCEFYDLSQNQLKTVIFEYENL